jgi:hypothetical protein
MSYLLWASIAYGAWWWFKKDHRGEYMPALRGDTLPGVAKRFDVTTTDILAANPAGFSRFYTPSGMPVAFKLPANAKDAGAGLGAQGKVL